MWTEQKKKAVLTQVQLVSFDSSQDIEYCVHLWLRKKPKPPHLCLGHPVSMLRGILEVLPKWPVLCCGATDPDVHWPKAKQ